MSNHNEEELRKEVKLELTPMIDVTFLILVFFMCTLRFKTLESKLVSYLPTNDGLDARAKEELPEPVAELVLRVANSELSRPPLEREVTLHLAGSSKPLGRLRAARAGEEPSPAGPICSPPQLLGELERRLSQLKLQDESLKAKINAWPGCPHALVVPALDVLRRAGIEDISFSGIPRSVVTELRSGHYDRR